MRKQCILFYTLLIISSVFFSDGSGKIFAQTYIPFPTDSAQWSVRHTINNPFSQSTVQYKMKGDTLLNGITYHKIYYSLDLVYNSPNQTLHCFVREDTTKKVFVKYPASSGIDTSEFVLYDFNKEINDTVNLKLYSSTDSAYKFQILNKFTSSTNIDTREYYQLIGLNVTFCTGFDWIMGIGSVLSPFYNEIPMGSCYDDGYELSCFWYKGTYIRGGTYCDYETGIKERTNSRYYTTVYPNPNDGNMILEYQLSENESGILVISDITGKQIRAYNLTNKTSKMAIDASILNPGLYLYEVYINNTKIKTDKVIISK